MSEEEQLILGVFTREELTDAVMMGLVTAILGFFFGMLTKMAAAYFAGHKWFEEEG